MTQTATTPVLAARDVSLSYGDDVALRDVTLELYAGERVALMGPSGSGKSSLLHCLAGVVLPDSGEIHAGERRLDQASESVRSATRLRTMGMVFQFGGLVPELTLLENVMLPLQVLGRPTARSRQAALEMLARLGVADVADHRSGAVSGGQAQRAAVARALVHGPSVVLADEPTGALDSVTGERVLETMVSLCRESGAALLVVTHDNLVAAHLDRHVSLRDGAVETTVGVGR
jgi:putative ABC transport system ATP-binding protein